MKRGVLLIIGLLGLFVIGISIFFALRGGSTTTNPNQKILKIWSPFNEERAYQRMSDRFFEQHPDYRIEFRYVEAKDAKDYEAQVVNAIANGQGPDLWIVRSDWIPKHAPKSAPAPAPEGVNPIEVAKSIFVPNLVDINSYQNKFYGVPLSADSLVLIYNFNYYGDVYSKANQQQRTVLDIIPSTWSDLKNQSAIVSQVNGSNITKSAISLGTVDTVYAPVDALSLFLNQSGASILTKDGSAIAFGIPIFEKGKPRFSAIEALDFYTSFARKDKPNYSWNDSLGQGVDAFINQKTGAVIGYHSTLQQILERNPKFEIRVSPMVQRKEKVERVDFAGSWSHIVNAESAIPAVAWDFLTSISDEFAMSEYSKATGKITALLNADFIDAPIKPILADTNEAAGIVASQFYYSKQFKKPEWQKVDEILQDAIRQVSILGKSPQNSVDTAVERFKELLDN